MVKDAELSKAKLNRPPGMEYNYACDEQFFRMLAHIDKTLQDRIKKGDVDIDLSKLLVKKKMSSESDKLEIRNKDGRSFFVPSSEKDQPIINCFKRWEQAFRILSGIYTQMHPDRANQLYHYVDTISTAADSFVWENVYNYDQTFRQSSYDRIS